MNFQNKHKFQAEESALASVDGARHMETAMLLVIAAAVRLLETEMQPDTAHQEEISMLSSTASLLMET